MKYITISILLILIGGTIILILDERYWSQTSVLGYVGIGLFTIGLVLIPVGAIVYCIKKWF